MIFLMIVIFYLDVIIVGCFRFVFDFNFGCIGGFFVILFVIVVFFGIFV